MTDGAPLAEIYRACAEASWDAPGTQRLWCSHQRETYVELMLARPDFCALVDVAYRAGREDAAKAIENADTSGWPGGRGSDVDGCQERAAAVARGTANTERGSE